MYDKCLGYVSGLISWVITAMTQPVVAVGEILNPVVSVLGVVGAILGSI